MFNLTISQNAFAGFVQRKWVWLLIFSPLWASLFINFGLGPVVSRTDDKLPVIGNCLGFALGAASPYLVAKVGGALGVGFILCNREGSDGAFQTLVRGEWELGGKR